jgi:hypothetical protein
MAGISGLATLGSLGLYTSTASPAAGLTIGQLVWDGKTGKAFRYVLNGGAALVTGNLLQEAVEDTTYENMAIGTAGVVGDAYLQVTNGTATITSDQFKGGTINAYTAGTVAVGDEYTITAVTGTLTTGGALKVWLDRPLRYAYTTNAKVNMNESPWSGVIQAPATTQTGMAVGVAIYPIALSQYGWIQTHGVCSVLSDGSTFAVGSDVGTPSGTAGCVTVYAAGTTHQRVGVVRQAAASAHCITALLQID